MRRNLPRHVRILSRDYTVARVAKKTIEKSWGGDNVYADIDPDKGRIRVAKGLSREAAWSYFEHEVAHGVIWELGFTRRFEHDPNLEEDVVEKLMPAWLGIISPRRAP